MIPRSLLPQILKKLETVPAVVLLGPRQVGKTTLALKVAGQVQSVYLDMESQGDLAKLSVPELYLESKRGSLVILDEVQHMPDIFTQIRVLIDRNKRHGIRGGQFLLLGSASPKLLQQSSESLAGRVSYLELPSLMALEVPRDSIEMLWLRGGFPESFLSPSDRTSFAWLRDFIRTYLERDIPAFGNRIPVETLRRLWIMLAYQQGGLLNLSQLGSSLGIDSKTVSRYIDLLTDLFLLRRLSPRSGNTRKRLVRSPKVYIRDSGLVHCLLGISDVDALLSHPVAGASWEGFVIENLISQAPPEALVSFYRTNAGAEIDLLIEFTDGQSWSIEIKRNIAPKPGKGFYISYNDVNATRGFIVYPGNETYQLNDDITVTPLTSLCEMIRAQALALS